MEDIVHLFGTNYRKDRKNWQDKTTIARGHSKLRCLSSMLNVVFVAVMHQMQNIR